MPSKFLCISDTYHTIESGAKNFLIVAILLERRGFSSQGIRLDSGDLASLSIEAKALFKSTGDLMGIDFSHLKVVASNDLNEKSIRELNDQNHQIDVFGVGTNLVTCQA